MKIAFIQFLYYEYLGIMYLSSSLKKQGHKVEVFICPSGRNREAFIDELVAFQPEVAGFSIMTGSESAALALTRQIKDRIKVYAVFGGPHPTVAPEIIANEGVDCVCLGEAETALSEIVASLAAGDVPRRVPGAWFKIDGAIVKNEVGPLARDLETLPRPDRSLYREKYPALRGKRAGFIAGRGCPFQCAFCANHALLKLYQGKGGYVRQRPVAAVIDEILETVIGRGIASIYFEDDTFIMNREWVLEFCSVYQKKIGLPFSCHIRADLATEELVAALARAHCTVVSFGVETGNVRTRRRLLNKHVTDEQLIACAGMLRKYGIRFRTLNILGLPGETLDDAFQTIDINIKIKADYPWCSLFQPLPGTAMWEQSVAQGLFDARAARTQPSFFKDSPLLLENKNEIINLHKLFIYAVKFPSLCWVIRRAIRARPNAGFDLLFAVAHAWVYFRSGIVPLGDMITLGFMNLARYLPRGRRQEGSA